MAGIGVAVAEGPDLFRLADHRLVDRLGDHDGGDRQIGGGERLGDRDDVGLKVVGLRPEHRPGAPEPADHLVRDEQDVVAF